jgi:hypothetical protein
MTYPNSMIVVESLSQTVNPVGKGFTRFPTQILNSVLIMKLWCKAKLLCFTLWCVLTSSSDTWNRRQRIHTLPHSNFELCFNYETLM